MLLILDSLRFFGALFCKLLPQKITDFCFKPCAERGTCLDRLALFYDTKILNRLNLTNFVSHIIFQKCLHH